METLNPGGSPFESSVGTGKVGFYDESLSFLLWGLQTVALGLATRCMACALLLRGCARLLGRSGLETYSTSRMISGPPLDSSRNPPGDPPGHSSQNPPGGSPWATPGYPGWRVIILGEIDPPGGMVLFLGGVILFLGRFFVLVTPGTGTTPPGPEPARAFRTRPGVSPGVSPGVQG